MKNFLLLGICLLQKIKLQPISGDTMLKECFSSTSFGFIYYDRVDNTFIGKGRDKYGKFAIINGEAQLDFYGIKALNFTMNHVGLPGIKKYDLRSSDGKMFTGKSVFIVDGNVESAKDVVCNVFNCDDMLSQLDGY